MQIHTKNLIMRGELLDNAERALILVHGRHASAENILGLIKDLTVEGFSLLAPQASDYSWFPKKFAAAAEENEPHLSSGLQVLDELVNDVFDAGLHARELYFLGFSQGACLVAEYTARNARQYGGVFLLSGGLVGKTVELSKYHGKFYGTPIFLSCGGQDDQLPIERLEKSGEVFAAMGAKIEQHIYPEMSHTVTDEELEAVNRIIAERG